MESEVLSTDGGPAFPSEGEGHGNPKFHSPGMTLRDYFAGQALSAIADDYQSKPEWIAERAYYIADAMLKAREAKNV
jgi:hypothetical protein